MHKGALLFAVFRAKNALSDLMISGSEAVVDAAEFFLFSSARRRSRDFPSWLSDVACEDPAFVGFLVSALARNQECSSSLNANTGDPLVLPNLWTGSPRFCSQR